MAEVASALDNAYHRYCDWCNEFGYPVADYATQLKQEFEGMGMKRLLSFGEAVAQTAIGPQPQPITI